MMGRTVGAVLIGAIAGLALGYQLWRVAPIVEPPAEAVRQEDGSLVLERAPDPTAKPAHHIPQGATLERVATVTVQPDPVTPAGADSEDFEILEPEKPAPCSCTPVHVDLSLIRLEDGSRRVIASARGGTVLGGVDVPIESARPSRSLVWAAGVERDVLTGRMGGFLERDLDRVLILPLPLRVGVSHVPGDRGGRWGVRVGLRF